MTLFHSNKLSFLSVLPQRCTQLTAALVLLGIAGCGELPQQSENSAPPVIGSASITSPATAAVGGTRIGLEIPDALLQMRNLDSDQLFPAVTITANGQQQAFNLERVNDTAFSGTIEVPANTDVTIDITWRENFQQTQLLIATFSGNVPVANQALAVSLDAMDYRTDFDDDGDGFSNLEERIAASDPFNPESFPLADPGPTTVSVLVPLVDAALAPTIDGTGAVYAANELRLVGEWGAAANATGLDGTTPDLFIDSLMISRTGNESSPFHAWAAVHDGVFLYVLVLVEDSGTRSADSMSLADDDGIEIFIDGDNSNLSLYGSPDDRYFRIALLDSEANPNNSSSAAGRFEPGENSAPIPQGITFAVGVQTGPLGISTPGERQDVYEVQIPLADFGILPGQPFGIEVQINDDDDGGARDAKWGWNHPMRRASDLDLTIANPSFMGTAQLR